MTDIATDVSPVRHRVDRGTGVRVAAQTSGSDERAARRGKERTAEDLDMGVAFVVEEAHAMSGAAQVGAGTNPDGLGSAR